MLTIQDIERLIPHRYPFLLVDRVVEMEPGKRIVAIKNVTANEWFFQGHFPGFQIMPGVLIVEALAQTGAVLLLSDDVAKGQIPLFAGIEKCRFRQQVTPGDTLTLELEVISRRGPVGKGKAKATVNGKVAAECELTFALAPMPAPVPSPALAAPDTSGTAPA
jgi:3-hydroxyacyl-[acyl-carrier-protein] dehydratase